MLFEFALHSLAFTSGNFSSNMSSSALAPVPRGAHSHHVHEWLDTSSDKYDKYDKYPVLSIPTARLHMRSRHTCLFGPSNTFPQLLLPRLIH